MATATIQERTNAQDHLRAILATDQTIYTKVVHVSRSGMSRGIEVYAVLGNEIAWLTGLVGLAIDKPQSRKDWQDGKGLRCNGYGMDFGADIVRSLNSYLSTDATKFNLKHRTL